MMLTTQFAKMLHHCDLLAFVRIQQILKSHGDLSI